jgi:hypothetical protein
LTEIEIFILSDLGQCVRFIALDDICPKNVIENIDLLDEEKRRKTIPK